MRKIKIYTAGKMSGLPYNEQIKWRFDLEAKIRHIMRDCGTPLTNLTVVNPPLYYNYEQMNHQSEREVKDWELAQLKSSDVVVVNLNGVSTSVGTLYELATADAMNSFGSKDIFVIGIGGDEAPLHPWIEETLHRKEKTLDDAAKYIYKYLML